MGECISVVFTDAEAGLQRRSAAFSEVFCIGRQPFPGIFRGPAHQVEPLWASTWVFGWHLQNWKVSDVRQYQRLLWKNLAQVISLAKHLPQVTSLAYRAPWESWALLQFPAVVLYCWDGDWYCLGPCLPVCLNPVRDEAVYLYLTWLICILLTYCCTFKWGSLNCRLVFGGVGIHEKLNRPFEL